MPTCWVNVASDPQRYENPQPEFLIAARAAEFDLPFVCANKFGMETAKVGYCGRSLVADRAGCIVHEAPGVGEHVLVEDIELGTAATYTEPLWGELLAIDVPVVAPGATDGPISVMVSAGVASGNADLIMAAHGESTATVITPSDAGTLTARAVGRVGCVTGDALLRFAPMRLLALQGMEIMCAFDAPDTLTLLRTRAVENRCFIVAVCRGGRIRVITPDGSVQCDAEGAVTVEMTPSSAAVKTVAPGTDIWEQRRVNAYRN